jgi:hypothetical protein
MSRSEIPMPRSPASFHRFALLVCLTVMPLGAAQAQETGKGCEKVTCPAENGEFALHLPNPDDCGSFCKCDWGTAYWFACPGDLHFNEELQVCDWPDKAGCKVP